jgi:hypothetical protein
MGRHRHRTASETDSGALRRRMSSFEADALVAARPRTTTSALGRAANILATGSADRPKVRVSDLIAEYRRCGEADSGRLASGVMG